MEIDWQAAGTAVFAVGAQVPAIAQIFFWFTGGTLAILTYLRAKKTVLQPAKTEVFKLQVAKLQQLLDELSWNGPQDAWQRSGLEQSFEINASALMQAYAETLGLRKAPGTEDIWPKPVSSFFREEIARDDDLVLIEPGARKFEPDPDKTLTTWDEYKHIWVHLGPKMQETLEQLDRFQADPVIPTFVSLELQEIRGDLLSAVKAIGPTMDVISESICIHYPTAEDFIEAEWGWINNQHPPEHRYGFYDRLEKLRASIRHYLKSDQMFDL